VVSGFCHTVDENSILLGYYTATSHCITQKNAVLKQVTNLQIPTKTMLYL
jgi:hypothetical protein